MFFKGPEYSHGFCAVFSRLVSLVSSCLELFFGLSLAHDLDISEESS